MDDRRNSDPNLDATSFTAPPSRRASGSLRSSSSGGYQLGRRRSSGRPSSDEDVIRALKEQLFKANSRLKGYELHAADAEEQISALTSHLKLINDRRVTAVQDAAKANEELRLYRTSLESANQEIQRAQEIIDRIEKERYDAEKAAAEAKTMARRFQRELLVMKAMEEGRKLGVQEGFEQARALAFQETDMDEAMDEQGYANEYLDYAEPDLRPRSLVVPNEEIVVHSPAPPSVVHPPEPEPEPPIIERAPPEPIPVPPPQPIQPIPTTRPFRSPSPSVTYPPVCIPPDGYIPTIGSDNIIRSPPPHELAKPPPTPEQPPSPQLPDVPPQETPRPSAQSHRRRQSGSSLASALTPGGALGRPVALSAIPEARSPYAATPAQSADGTGPSSALGISVVPPPNQSRAGASRSQPSNNRPLGGEGITNVSRPSSVVSQLFGDRVIGQPGPSTSDAAQNSNGAAMPGAYQDQTDQTSTRELPRASSSSRQRLVADDATSVRSRDTLTTPQARRRSNQPRTSLNSLTIPPYEDHGTGWEDAVRLAGSHVPVPHDNRTTRPISQVTDRSNQ
ncbi:hypothetical protein C0993_006725 [Termitomyces sp. T159_Od127]|nr:hypothetical protein C0993_006725 [Termitomyces sp. T159_Od127]